MAINVPNFPAHVSNFLQANGKILLDLINEQNNTALPETAVTFGAPAEKTPGQIATLVTVTSAEGSGYRGSVDFDYNRVPLGFMGTNEPDLIIETDATSTQGLIEFLNMTFGTLLTPADIVDAPIPALQPDQNTAVTITADGSSLVWHGTHSLQLTKTLIDLDTVLTTTTLDGLYPPAV